MGSALLRSVQCKQSVYIYIYTIDGGEQTTSADQRGYECEYDQDEVIKREQEGACVSEK